MPYAEATSITPAVYIVVATAVEAIVCPYYVPHCQHCHPTVLLPGDLHLPHPHLTLAASSQHVPHINGPLNVSALKYRYSMSPHAAYRIAYWYRHCQTVLSIIYIDRRHNSRPI